MRIGAALFLVAALVGALVGALIAAPALAEPCVGEALDLPLAGAEAVEVIYADVPSVNFPLFWQEGLLKGYRYRIYVDGSAEIAPPDRAPLWKIEVGCAVGAASCDYRVKGSAPADAQGLAEDLGRCVMGAEAVEVGVSQAPSTQVAVVAVVTPTIAAEGKAPAVPAVVAETEPEVAPAIAPKNTDAVSPEAAVEPEVAPQGGVAPAPETAVKTEALLEADVSKVLPASKPDAALAVEPAVAEAVESKLAAPEPKPKSAEPKSAELKPAEPAAAASKPDPCATRPATANADTADAAEVVDLARLGVTSVVPKAEARAKPAAGPCVNAGAPANNAPVDPEAPPETAAVPAGYKGADVANRGVASALHGPALLPPKSEESLNSVALAGSEVACTKAAQESPKLTLQRLLVASGQAVAVDGRLGPQSRAALVAVLGAQAEGLSLTAAIHALESRLPVSALACQ